MTWTKDNGRVAKQNADYAKQQGDNAKDQADYAKTQGNFAKNEASNLSQLKTDVTKATNEAEIQAKYAKEQGDHAKKQGDYAKAEADKIKDLDDAKFNQRLVDVEDQVKDTERQTQKLQHGVNVLNGTAVSPVDIEIYGRTLVNLIYDISPFSITLDPNKYYLIISETNAQVDVNGNLQNTPYKFTGRTDVQITWSPGNVALYEVQKNDYDKILVDWDSVKVNNLYPYVKGVQHLTNPYVESEGENLLPPFTEWNLHANAKVISPYELELDAKVPSNYSFSPSIPVTPGTTFSFSAETNDVGYPAVGLQTLDSDNKPIATIATNPYTIPNGVAYIRMRLSNVTYPKIVTFKNPILSLGSTPKPFVPRNPSYLFTDVKLGHIGTSKDLLYQQDGQWLVRKAINKDILLYGTLNWRFIANDNLFKKVGIQSFLSENARRLPYIITKYNGFVLGDDYNNGNGAYVGFNDNFLYLSILNEDSGFISTYSPNSNEIKAYFNGWQVKTADTTGKPTAWKSIVDGTDAPTQTLAYVSTNMAKDYTPYKLSYVLATPQIINVTDKVEGDIAINGLTQVSIDSGVVVREKANPILYTTYYRINDVNVPLSLLEYKADKILSVYKNGVMDTKWKIESVPTNGKQRAIIPQADYDPTAEYTVTYLALDRHLMTVNATEVKATYANNIRSALDDVVVKQSDIATTVSVNVRSIAELYKRVRLLEGV